MWAKSSCHMNSAHPLPPPLNSAHPREGSIGLSENCDKEPPVLVAMGLDVPGFGWGGAHLKCKDPECNHKCGCCDEERTLEVLSVAAERVGFGDPTGMEGSVPGERELPAQRGGCPHDAAAKQRGSSTYKRWSVRPSRPARWWWCVARWASWFPSTAKRAP